MKKRYDEETTRRTATLKEPAVIAPMSRHWPSMNQAPCSLGRGMLAGLFRRRPIAAKLTHRLDECRLGLSAQKLDLIVDNRLRNALYSVALRHFGELAHFDNVGNDLLALDPRRAAVA